MSGKSRLAAALVNAGAEYLSDEFAVLDSRGFVHPYPRPLSIRDERGVRSDLTAADVGRCRQFGGEGLRVGLLADVTFDETVERLRIWQISRAQAVLVLLANSVAAQTQPEAVLEAAVATVAHAQCFSGVRGEAIPSAAELLDLLALVTSPPPDPKATGGGDRIQADDPVVAAHGR
jgi:hypothetical protein